MPENVLPVQVRQAQVENNQIGRLLRGELDRLLAALSLDQTIAFACERRAQKSADRQFILNQ